MTDQKPRTPETAENAPRCDCSQLEAALSGLPEATIERLLAGEAWKAHNEVPHEHTDDCIREVYLLGWAAAMADARRLLQHALSVARQVLPIVRALGQQFGIADEVPPPERRPSC